MRGSKPVYGKGVYDLPLPKSKKIGDRNIFYEDCYLRWERMLHRCYGNSTKKVRPTYNGCEVCEEWLTFSNFKAWIKSHPNWNELHLDKDLLVEGNKKYSSDTCVMVEPRINHFMTLRGNDRGDYPLGVHKSNNPKIKTNKFIARVNVETGKRKSLGCFKTPFEAHYHWQLAKRDRAIHLQSEQTDSRVIAGLQRIIDKLQHDIDNKLETKSL